MAAIEFHEILLAVTADGQPQPFRQRIDAGHADAVQTAGNLVGVLVELAAGMQHAHDDFGRGALGFVLVVEFDAGGDAAAVVGDGNRVVGMDGDYDIVAMSGQCFVNGVVHDFEHHVMQAGAVGGIADVHARAFAHGLQTLELLDARFIVAGLNYFRSWYSVLSMV